MHQVLNHPGQCVQGEGWGGRAVLCNAEIQLVVEKGVHRISPFPLLWDDTFSCFIPSIHPSFLEVWWQSDIS